MSETESVTRQVRMHGRVQGVFFRSWTKEKALGLGLTGWVRNRGDGTVEAVFQGPAEAVEAMIAQCHDGPEDAHVTKVEVGDGEPPMNSAFEVRSTA